MTSLIRGLDRALSSGSSRKRRRKRKEDKAAFRPDIEGLRAIAVLFVLIWHAGVSWLPGGFVGVDVFFVVSGFLMTTILHREHVRYGRISVAEFYGRRARRLIPASTLTLLATGLATFLVLPDTRWRDIGLDIAAAGGYLVNWRLADRAVDYLAQDTAPSPIQHFWSLSIEEQFYIFWPLLIVLLAWVIKRTGGSATAVTFAALVIIAAGSLAWSVYLTDADASRAYFVTTTRLWELALGGLVALAMPLFHKMPKMSAAALAWIGVAGILGTGFLLTTAVPFPGFIALIPTAATALVLAAGPAAGNAGPVRILANKPTQWIGGCSYSMYLWHWPVLVIGGYWITDGLREISVIEGVVLVALSVLPAWLSLKFVEDPIRRAETFVDSVKNSMALAFLGIGISVVVGLLVTAVVPRAPDAYQSSYVPSQSDEVVAADQPMGAEVLGDDPLTSTAAALVDKVPSITPSPQAANADNPDVNDCQLNYTQVIPKFCEYGDKESDIEVALVGDSHAGQWIPAMEAVAAERGWKLVVATKSACPYLDIAVFSDNLNRPYDECRAWNEQMGAYLTGPGKPDAVVLSYGVYNTGDRNLLISGAQARWGPLVAQGTKVIVIRDTPAPGRNVPDCVAEHGDRLTACARSRDEALAKRDQSQAAAVEAVPGVQMVDLTDWICPGSQCSPVIGGVLVFRDNTHMTATYSRSLTPQLAKRFPSVP
ncbi:acyltransferase family protein [Mycolicibacterium baixiangningiae]|uniref:acyltransferase family protein n=1 Tax=Mycolicibacterium baixiangningiae TaxID=2761578 RepID=UPI001866A943|nr:acyltransferase family protein [Mycolicibacterium baixiangningiae]